ncbi:hypothetical protein ACE6H2_014494 [Prunus campanulata]
MEMEVMSLERSLDKSSAGTADVDDPASTSNSNETKINVDDDLSPKSSVQGNNKEERTAAGSFSESPTSTPLSTQILRKQLSLNRPHDIVIVFWSTGSSC